jgi:anti-sigma regulatory factor (Ser/Thr protein kinase)
MDQRTVNRAAAEPAAMNHDALFYGADDEFVAGLVPFLRDGLARGDAAVAAVTRPNIGLLRDALGADAAAVTFIDRDEWYRRPVSTVAGWFRLLGEATGRGHAYVRIVGEVAFGAADRHPAWTRYESALNRVFTDAPAWIVCPYDTRALPAGVLADARRTHPVVSDPGRRHSDAYLAPELLLRAIDEPVPPATGPPLLELVLDGTVTTARHAVGAAVSAAGRLGRERVNDLLLAVTEIAANSLAHGGGRRELRVWAPPWGVLCEVTDEGPRPPDPLIGYLPPVRGAAGGRGLWLARQLCDALAIDHRDGVTRVRLAVRPAPPGVA